MSNIANITDGKIDAEYNPQGKKKQEALGSNLGYDQFLQLLCAEMQYQDPLEPTTNTDYVAQLATFSQLEATLSVEESQQSAMANGLVGKQVAIKHVNDSTGLPTMVEGKVDYVMRQDGKVYLSVEGGLYPLAELDTVSDPDYYEANAIAQSIADLVSKLPAIEDLSLAFTEDVAQIQELYDGLTDYQKGFVTGETTSKLTRYVDRIVELKKAAEQDANKNKTPVLEGEPETV